MPSDLWLHMPNEVPLELGIVIAPAGKDADAEFF